MDGRTRFATSGFIAGTATIAAVAAVVIANSAALADTSGTPVKAEAVILPAATASAQASEAPAAPVATAEPGAEAEVAKPEAPVVPQVTTVATAPSTTTEDAVVRSAFASGTWASAYDWCKDHGWSSAQAEAWIERLETKLENFRAERRSQGDRDGASKTSGRDREGRWSGSEEDRSRDTPDHRD